MTWTDIFDTMKDSDPISHEDSKKGTVVFQKALPILSTKMRWSFPFDSTMSVTFYCSNLIMASTDFEEKATLSLEVWRNRNRLYSVQHEIAAGVAELYYGWDEEEPEMLPGDIFVCVLHGIPPGVIPAFTAIFHYKAYLVSPEQAMDDNRRVERETVREMAQRIMAQQQLEREARERAERLAMEARALAEKMAEEERRRSATGTRKLHFDDE